MRRLARHVFTLCAAASHLLCVAVCVLWARSGYVGDHGIASLRGLRDADALALFEVFSNRAGLNVQVQRLTAHPGKLDARHWSRHRPADLVWSTWSPPGWSR